MKTETKDNHDKAMEAFSALVEALERLSENDRKRVLYSTAGPLKIPVQPLRAEDMLP